MAIGKIVEEEKLFWKTRTQSRTERSGEIYLEEYNQNLGAFCSFLCKRDKSM